MSTAIEQLACARDVLRLRRRPFAQFVERHNPSLLLLEHAPLLVDVANRILIGELRNVLVLAPPRYIKSEIFSRLLPACYLRKFPRRRVGLSCYGAELAWELSEQARDYYAADGGSLSTRSRAKRHWASASGSGMWATGTGGALLGRGFHLGGVDDPIDPEKASSPTWQRRFRIWWPAKFLSRRDPGSQIVFTMQRLGVGDPVDFLFRREVGEGTPRAPIYWHVVALDEIKSDEPFGPWDGPRGLPETCTLEPDDRAEGELLAPSLFDADEVEERRTTAGPYVTSAQRQQRPMRPSGDFWREKWFTTYDTLPRNAYNGGKDWDTAYTKDEANSATAWVESYRGPGEENAFPIYIENVDWDWLEFPELVERMKALAGPHYVEEKASGKSAVQALKVYGIAAEPVKVLQDKFARAAAAQPAVANKRVFVNQRVRDTLLFGEGQGLLRVTAESLLAGVGGLDLNDAFVQMLHRHLGLSQTKRGIKLQWR